MLDAETLNRTGLAAQFLAFWLLTPEVISPSTLARLQELVRRGLAAAADTLVQVVFSVLLINLLPLAFRGLGTLVFTGLLTGAALALALLCFLFAELLEASASKRRRFAIGGAVLFIFGTGAQFVATF